MLLTIGYEGRTVDEVVAVLRDRRVDVLVDVRQNAVSRKPGLSERRLAEALAAAGVEYRHEPSLGNPKDNRAALRRGDAAARDRYRAVLDDEGLAAVDRLVAMVGEQRVALLCFERDEAECHRALIVERVVAARPEVEVGAL
jgi:uncharacterized protein (DUF488 family)